MQQSTSGLLLQTVGARQRLALMISSIEVHVAGVCELQSTDGSHHLGTVLAPVHAVAVEDIGRLARRATEVDYSSQVGYAAM